MAQVKRINPMSLRNLTAYVRDLPKITRDVGSKIIKELAEDYRQRLIDAIYSQKYADTYSDLSADWVKRKGHDLFWMNQLQLIESIGYVRKDMGDNRRSYLVGFNNEVHGGSGKEITNAHLAYVLEYGIGVPARPLVEPTWEDFYPEASRRARAVFKERMRRGRSV